MERRRGCYYEIFNRGIFSWYTQFRCNTSDELGGLISRYVIGLLYARGVFEKMQPVNFTTFATPHLGIRHANPGFLYKLVNVIGPRLLGSSGRQMFIADRISRPLLLRMTEKGTLLEVLG